MEDATDRVTGAIATLFRLEGSRRIHRQQAEAAGVAVPQLGLRLLGRLIDHGPSSPGQLAALMELDPALVTRLVRQLEESGLVSRERSSDDRRVSTIDATAEGIEAFSRVRELIWRHMREVLDGWDATEIEALAGLLERLVGDVQRVPYTSVSAPAAVSRP